MKRAILILGFVLSGITLAYSQNSIKLGQQSTTFFYAQLNLHTGVSNSGSGVQFGLPGRGTGNQISVQVLKIHQPLLQKGYTPLIALDSWKVRTTFGYSQSTSTFEIVQPQNNGGGPGGGQGGGPGGGGQGDGFPVQETPDLVGTTTNSHLNMNLQDAWLKFKTKWDRTTIKVGYASMSFGHHPDIDANASFMTNVVGTEFGFNRDLGVYIKTPLSRGLDLEMGLSSGGAVGNQIFRTNQNAEEPDEDIATANGRWLVAGRIGQPSFRKNELGLLFAVGNITSSFGPDPDMNIVRVGGEWIYKFRERVRLTNQVVAGQTKTESEGSFASLTLQNNLDFFASQHVIIGLSNSLNSQNSMSDGANYLKSTLAGSLTYVFSPHTRIRLNQFVVPRDYSGNSNWGISLQFVTGLGKR